MKKRVLSFFLALVICVGTSSQITASAASAPSEQQAYQAMIALKSQYPEGMRWTNDNYYGWKGGIFSGGYGCAGFAFMLSDAAFGSRPARHLTEFAFADVRVGDILRINNNSHSVIVLEVHDDHVVIAEGNYNSSIHWGRTLSATAVSSADYLLTRYPVEIPPSSFDDVPAWCSDAVDWAVYEEITNGTGDNKFSPGNLCTNGMIITFLWRAAGQPEPNPSYQVPIPLAGNEYYANAVRWAYQWGIIPSDFAPGAYCTRINAITYIWKAAGSYYYPPYAAFTDLAGVDSAGQCAVSWAIQNGITNGTSATSFSPNNVCSRGQIVTFLYRFYVPDARLNAN